MRVTRSEHPERIERFAHIPRAPRGRARCGAECPGTGDRCSRARGHPGPHVSHGRLGRPVAAWDGPADGAPLTKSPVDAGFRGPAVQKNAERERPVARWFRDRFLASFPETVMLIFFIAFVFFSIVWALQIL